MKKVYLLLCSLLLIILPVDVLAYSNYIIPGGENIGIDVKSNGVMVVGFYNVNGKHLNSFFNPGDYIVKVNDKYVNSISDLVSEIDNSIKNNSVSITYNRDDTLINAKLEVKLVNGVYKTGLYVKDGLNGIGTITYIDPETGVYGALGHEIIESVSNKKIEVKTGTIFDSYVLKVNKSMDGNPGSKKAKINFDESLGKVSKNTKFGIFGKYDNIPKKELMEIGYLDDVTLGEAFIYTVVNGKEIKEYRIDIKRIDKNSNTKNFYFEVSDEVVNDAGGIVQGMSGSPIIQNNKIIGAVTHVIIDDVKTGYGISIITMLEEGDK